MFWENSNPFDCPEGGQKIIQILFPACLYAILFVTTLKRDRVQYFGKVTINTVLMGAKWNKFGFIQLLNKKESWFFWFPHSR